MIPSDRILHHLFLAVELCVFSAGGTGEGWVISPEWKELADRFENWDIAEHQYFKTRKNEANRITFYHYHTVTQETVTFIPDAAGLPEYAPAIIVELP